MQSGEALVVLSSIIENVEVEAGIGSLHMIAANEESSENKSLLVVILDIPLTI